MRKKVEDTPSAMSVHTQKKTPLELAILPQTTPAPLMCPEPPPGEIPRTMSSTQWVAKKRIESTEVLVNVTLCFISRFPYWIRVQRGVQRLALRLLAAAGRSRSDCLPQSGECH